MKKSTGRKILLGAAGLIISVALIIYITSEISLAESFQLIGTLGWHHWIILILIYLLGFLIRSIRWNVIVRNHKHQTSFFTNLRSIIVGYGGNNIIPARGGEVLRMEYYYRKTGLSRIQSISLIAIERVFDGFTLVLILGLSYFLIGANNPWIQNLLLTSFIIFTSVLAVIWYVNRNSLSRLKSITKPKFLAKIVGFLESTIGGVGSSKDLINIGVLSLLIWLVEGSMFCYAIGLFTDISNPYLAGYFLLTVVNFSILIPSLPGYIGVFQGATILALGIYGIPEQMSFSISIMIHLAQYLPITILGIIIISFSSMSFVKGRSQEIVDQNVTD